MSKVELVTQTSISSAAALIWINYAVQVAYKMSLTVGVCIVDVNGRVIGKFIMDGAPIITVDLIERKAKTALLGLSSHELGVAIVDSPAVLHSLSQLDSITTMGGGLPILVDGKIVGGFSIGGALVEQDIACAQAVVAHFA